MKKSLYYHIKKNCYLIFCLLLMCGCEDFLEAEEPYGQLNRPKVYEDESTARAAVTTLYGKLRDEVLLTGGTLGLSVLMGVYADEMEYYGFGGEPMDNFYQHRVFSDDLIVEDLWNRAYALIFMGNAVLEGLEDSKNLDEETKAQLRGEVLFVRSVTLFYLVNLFGDIPYPTTTDYIKNRNLKRIPMEDIYDSIVNDLNEAKNLLDDNYIGAERVRANKMVVAAFMARVYLYMEKWALAEAEADNLIGNTSQFSLEPNVGNEFLRESSSAILQFKPKNEGENTQEGYLFLLESGPPPLVSLNPELYHTMEPEDQRKQEWIGEVSDGNQNWYFPKKYKVKNNTGTSLEYSIVFRLSEQYLIRAEARAMLGNLNGSLSDLNKIRNRAGLQNSGAIGQNEIIKAITQERYFELFSEFGHRWFDIKRLGLANQILTPIKSGWKPTNVLLPLPEKELTMNPNLQPQNPGY